MALSNLDNNAEKEFSVVHVFEGRKVTITPLKLHGH